MAKTQKILSIEAIRGFAAIYVVLGHIILLFQPYTLFPKFEFLIKTAFGYGHEAVILFFIVSGFSIQYASSGIDFRSKKEIIKYFKRRLRRIYPIFAISLFIAICVLVLTKETLELKKIILSFLFLTDISSGSISDPISTNFPIWSLSYEMFYYLLFPVLHLCIRRFGVKRVFFITLGISLISSIPELNATPSHLSNLLQYYWTWTIGVVIAQYKLSKKNISVKYFRAIIISAIAFMLTIEKVNVIRDWFWCLFFVSLFVIFLNVTNEKLSRRESFLNAILGFISITACLFLTRFDKLVFHPDLVRYIIVALAVISLILIFIPISTIRLILRNSLSVFTKFGLYSYGIYIVHWPIIILIKFYLLDNRDHTIVSVISAILLSLFFIAVISVLLERVIQPKILRFIN